MPTRRILGFIVLCLLLLAVLAHFFPEEGLKWREMELRFPSLKTALLGQEKPEEEAVDPDEQLARMAEAFHLKNLSDLADSLDYYHRFFCESPVRIEFPDDNPARWDSLFARLEKASELDKPLHIIHYGDSQIEQDRISSSLRRQFFDWFGGMGCGMLPAIQPIQTPHLSQQSGGYWRRHVLYGPPELRASHRRYGPLAAVCQVCDTAWMSISPRSYSQESDFKSCRSLRLMLGHNTPGFTVRVQAGGKTFTQVLEDSCATFKVLRWKFSQPVSNIRIGFRGRAEIYGVLTDDNRGIAVDNVPMRGCSGTIFTRMDAAVLRESYREMQVALFILEYGGNSMPGIGGAESIHKYCESIGRQIRYLKTLQPEAEVLFIGPADMSKSVNGVMMSYPLLAQAVDSLRATCLKNGAAFWDMYRVMGGHNSMLKWVGAQPQLAAPDYVHFTPKGARKIAGMLNSSLAVCYDYYRFRSEKLDDSTMVQLSALNREEHDYSSEFYELMQSSGQFDSILMSEDDDAVYEEFIKSLQNE